MGVLIYLDYEYNIRVKFMKKMLIGIFIMQFVASIAVCNAYLERTEIEVSSYVIYPSSVNATSCIVMNCENNEVLYSQNIYQVLLPASITKILTCITVLEHYPLDDIIIINNEINQCTGSKIYLRPGYVVTVKDLLYGLMLNSGNDAALALALHLSNNTNDFMILMNSMAKKIGMKNSLFHNPSGLDEETKNYTTAYDMALLMSYALKNEAFREIANCREYCPQIISGERLYFHHKHRLVHTNKFVTGGKTGYTKLAGRTLVTSFKKNNQEIVIVTFKSSDDWHIHSELANRTFKENLDQKSETWLSNTYFPLIKPFCERLRGKSDD